MFELQVMALVGQGAAFDSLGDVEQIVSSSAVAITGHNNIKADLTERRDDFHR